MPITIITHEQALLRRMTDRHVGGTCTRRSRSGTETHSWSAPWRGQRTSEIDSPRRQQDAILLKEVFARGFAHVERPFSRLRTPAPAADYAIRRRIATSALFNPCCFRALKWKQERIAATHFRGRMRNDTSLYRTAMCVMTINNLRITTDGLSLQFLTI